jgi:hypothetical protein
LVARWLILYDRKRRPELVDEMWRRIPPNVGEIGPQRQPIAVYGSFWGSWLLGLRRSRELSM